jgi:hypothetical protein
VVAVAGDLLLLDDDGLHRLVHDVCSARLISV